MTTIRSTQTAPRPTRRGAVLAVNMTPEQQRRQDVQVRWLQEACAAQRRPMDRESIDPRSLCIQGRPRP